MRGVRFRRPLNELGVVFTLRRYAPDQADIAVYPAFFQCLLSTNRARGLLSGDFPDEDAHYLVHLAGRFVAYAAVFAGGSSASDPFLFVEDLATGATSHQWDLQAGNGFHFTGVVVTDSGSAAWINERPGGSYEVRDVNPASGLAGSELLDAGGAIAPIR